MPKTLETLMTSAPDARVIGSSSIVVEDLQYDSRAVQPGALFFCISGASSDGHDFAAAAVGNGAVAVVVERELDVEVPQMVVSSTRRAMGPIASSFFGDPSRQMTVIGVTGTNGKTTTTFMLESVFRALGFEAGLIGTVETHIGDEVLPVTRTTPEAIDLQRSLAQMLRAGVRGVAMEVSSHGLHMGRIDGTSFACAIFTNLTQDHLDYHGTMEEYFEAKALLFRVDATARAVINFDDDYGRVLAGRTDMPFITFGAEHEADVRAISITMDRLGSNVDVDVAGERVSLRVPLPARYNVTNALGVLAAARALDLPLKAVARGIESMDGVPGRLEPIEAGQDFTVLVDYAHTPDSLTRVLSAAREIITSDGARLVVVFGCGGDRDRGKRPLMGRVAAELADRLIITSDNPRTEEPLAIIAEIEAGARETDQGFESIADRREAIGAALRDARTGDVVVIAGKGHETGQQFADRTVPFDDRVVAREILKSIAR